MQAWGGFGSLPTVLDFRMPRAGAGGTAPGTPSCPARPRRAGRLKGSRPQTPLLAPSIQHPTFLRAAAGLQAAPPPPAQARKPKGLATVTCPLLSPLYATCKGWTAERLPPAYAMPCLPRQTPLLDTAPTFLRAAAGLQAAPPPPAQARKPKGLATVTCPLLSPLHATCKGWTAERLPPAYAMPCLPRQTPYTGTSHTARFLTWQTGPSPGIPACFPRRPSAWPPWQAPPPPPARRTTYARKGGRLKGSRPHTLSLAYRGKRPTQAPATQRASSRGRRGYPPRHPGVLPPPAQAQAPARAHGHRGKPPSAAPCAPHHIRTQGRAAERLPPAYATPCLPRQTPYAGTSHTARFLTWQTGLSPRHPSVLPPPAQAHAPARAHGHRGKPPSAAPCAPHHIRTQGRAAERLPLTYAIPRLPRQTPYAGTGPIQRTFPRRQQACRQGFPTAQARKPAA